MVVQPTTRQGLPTSALLKQICQGPAFLYLVVSTYVGWIACSQGWSAGPSGVTLRCACWRSKSAWTKNCDCAPVPLAAAAVVGAAAGATLGAAAGAALAAAAG